jgi:hypothetical protein
MDNEAKKQAVLSPDGTVHEVTSMVKKISYIVDHEYGQENQRIR